MEFKHSLSVLRLLDAPRLVGNDNTLSILSRMPAPEPELSSTER